MMEKGSFHQTQNQTQPPTPDELVQRVPLPNQLPKGMDFSELPLSGLKSSALESLIGQNEDLMARLSVSLRRGSESEDRITEIEKQNSSLHSRFAAIKEQYSILQEKDRISAARFLEVHAESVEYRKQASKLEKLYADLYIQAQAFQKRLVRSERHCARLKKVARHLQSRARNADQYRLELDHSAAAQHQAVQTFEAKLKGVRFEIESMHTVRRSRINPSKFPSQECQGTCAIALTRLHKVIGVTAFRGYVSKKTCIPNYLPQLHAP